MKQGIPGCPEFFCRGKPHTRGSSRGLCARRPGTPRLDAIRAKGLSTFALLTYLFMLIGQTAVVRILMKRIPLTSGGIYTTIKSPIGRRTLIYSPSNSTPMIKGTHFFRCFRILMAVSLLACAFALPAGAVVMPVNHAAAVTQNPCANTKSVADFSYSISPSNPLEVDLTDHSSCADRWRWSVSNKNSGEMVYTSPKNDASGRNAVVILPSPGTYYFKLTVGQNCVGCTDPFQDLYSCCIADNLAQKTISVTFDVPPATTSPAPVTSPATQPPQSSATTTSPTAEVARQTQQQSFAPVATAQGTAPVTAVMTTFAPAPAGQGSVTSGAISITTTPPGAEVWIDNEMKGASPATISALTPGTHTLMLRKTGYQNISTTFIIESGQTREYSSGLIQTAKSPGFSAPVAIGGIFMLFFARRLFR
jgi:hypothetical protein